MRNVIISSLLLSLASAAHAQPSVTPQPDVTPAPPSVTPAPPSVTQPGADEGVVIGDASGFDSHGNLHEHWLPYTSSGMRLDSDDFYQRVGRPDLAAAHAQRRTIAVGATIAGLAITGATIWYATSSFSQPAQATCNVNSPQFAGCVSANAAADQAHFASVSSATPWIVGGSVVGAAALGLATWYFTHPEPIDEAQAEQLAAAHNAGVHVTPYASTTGGGLSLNGHF